MSTADRVDAIRARLNAATPGPWEFVPGRFGGIKYTFTGWDGEPAQDYVISETYDGELVGERPGNAELIANAPADLAWLLEQLEAAQARAAAAEARLERAQSFGARAGASCVGPDPADTDRLTRQPRVRATPPADFGARFPETDEHRRINDEAALRLLEDDE